MGGCSGEQLTWSDWQRPAGYLWLAAGDVPKVPFGRYDEKTCEAQDKCVVDLRPVAGSTGYSSV